MKSWKTLIVASAALAVAAPAANATFDRSLPSTTPKAKVAKKVHHKPLTPKVKPTPRVLIIVAQGPTPKTGDWSGDCATVGNNCTDQQLCEFWFTSCDPAVADQATSAAAADSAAAEDQSATG